MLPFTAHGYSDSVSSQKQPRYCEQDGLQGTSLLLLLLQRLRDQALNHLKALSFFYPSILKVINRPDLKQEGQTQWGMLSPPPGHRDRPAGLPRMQAAPQPFQTRHAG